MSEIERARPERAQLGGELPDMSNGDGLVDAQVRADRLLRAADDAIARALSTDSERFLQATRQLSGQ